MKKTILIITLIILAFTVNAQNAVAKIKYKQAEEAFEKTDYATVLVKLDEAQKILGSTNPKILYLRLMATKGIVAAGKFDWDFLTEARKNAAYYIRQYSEMQGIEEKFRQVYEFSETLDAFPKTKELWDQKQEQVLQARAEWLKQRPLQVSDSLMKVFGVNECRTMNGFLTSPFAAQLKKSRESTKYTTIYDRIVNYTGYPPAGPFEARFNSKAECFFYSYILLSKTADTVTAKKIYQTFLDLYPAELGKEWVEQKAPTRQTTLSETTTTIIKQPATGNKGELWFSYDKYSDGALIRLSFYPE
jgi:hypothetical protein